MPRPEFQVPKLNAAGLAKANEIAEAFSGLLTTIEAIVPASRPRSLVITLLQEACFWAKRGIAELPAYQEAR